MSKPRLHPIMQFNINYLCFINKDHQVTQNLPDFADEKNLKELYRRMLQIRILDTKAINLQRMGKLGTYASSCGQEAVTVGIGHAMNPDDVYCPAYRDQGVLIQRRIAINEILSVWGGDERGNAFQNNQTDLPTCVTVSGQCLHAAGVAYAFKYRKQARAAVTIIGDGGTSKGDFYEAINLAGIWSLPLVIIINNNQWAISVPRTSQTAAQTLAQKGIAGQVESIQVDGNDVIAVRYAVAEAIQKARSSHGPSLIEAFTYRLADHTTADDAKRYRQQEIVQDAWLADPLIRLRQYLIQHGWWSEEQDQKLKSEIGEETETEVQIYLNKKKAAPTDMFDYLYAELPDSLVDQREELKFKT